MALTHRVADISATESARVRYVRPKTVFDLTGDTWSAILGVVPLLAWTLIIVTTVKYTGFARWLAASLSALLRNASRVTDYLHIPSEQLVDFGRQIAI